MKKLSIIEYTSYNESIKTALDEIGAPKVFSEQESILIKPNLINTSPPPITTPVECVKAIVEYIKENSHAKIIIAEGCGAMEYDTERVFEALGYTKLSNETGVSLVNLNIEKTKLLKNSKCTIFKEFHLPEIALSNYIISVPVLKAHSLADITGSLKNMMGFAPPEHYQQGGHWKKSAFHRKIHESITDLNTYRTPDLAVMDARIGMPEYHLGGSECDPPLNKIIAGFNPKEVDRVGAELLGMNWKRIGHLI